MATLLEPTVIQDALSRLDGWIGDTNQISRTVQLTDQQHAAAERRVMEAANAMNHHPDIERLGGATSFVLSTHSAGGVTELDVALAERIDAILAEEK